MATKTARRNARRAKRRRAPYQSSLPNARVRTLTLIVVIAMVAAIAVGVSVATVVGH